MRHVQCKDCGRSYDYDKDDFCPKCGSYNPPSSEGATALEAELLSRFDQNRARQSKTTTPEGPELPLHRTATKLRDPFAPRPSSAPPRTAPHLCTSPEEEEPRFKVPRGLFLFMLVGALVLITLIVSMALGSGSLGKSSKFSKGPTFGSAVVESYTPMT